MSQLNVNCKHEQNEWIHGQRATESSFSRDRDGTSALCHYSVYPRSDNNKTKINIRICNNVVVVHEQSDTRWQAVSFHCCKLYTRRHFKQKKVCAYARTTRTHRYQPFYYVECESKDAHGHWENEGKRKNQNKVFRMKERQWQSTLFGSCHPLSLTLLDFIFFSLVVAVVVSRCAMYTVDRMYVCMDGWMDVCVRHWYQCMEYNINKSHSSEPANMSIRVEQSNRMNRAHTEYSVVNRVLYLHWELVTIFFT